MTQDKKYDYRVLKNKQSWTGQILRRVTKKNQRVSKSQKFPTEAEAISWAEAELKVFSENQSKRNEREGKVREENEKLKAIKHEAMLEKLRIKAEKKAAAEQAAMEESELSADADFDDSFEEPSAE